MKIGDYQNNRLYFNNQILIDENFEWNAPEVFKLEIDENNQIASINNIRYYYIINRLL
ncbi:MAG: hypothetical protein PUB18_05235 [bacterium]|nr:hypothetical protein [bacterium]